MGKFVKVMFCIAGFLTLGFFGLVFLSGILLQSTFPLPSRPSAIFGDTRHVVLPVSDEYKKMSINDIHLNIPNAVVTMIYDDSVHVDFDYASLHAWVNEGCPAKMPLVSAFNNLKDLNIHIHPLSSRGADRFKRRLVDTIDGSNRINLPVSAEEAKGGLEKFHIKTDRIVVIDGLNFETVPDYYWVSSSTRYNGIYIHSLSDAPDWVYLDININTRNLNLEVSFPRIWIANWKSISEDVIMMINNWTDNEPGKCIGLE